MKHNSNKDFFAEVMPEHPHRGLYILLSVLVAVIMAGSLVMYQINTTKTEEVIVESPPPKSINGAVSTEELKRISSVLSQNTVSTTPLTTKELKKISDALSNNRQAKNIKPPTEEELQKIANTLNKK